MLHERVPEKWNYQRCGNKVAEPIQATLLALYCFHISRVVAGLSKVPAIGPVGFVHVATTAPRVSLKSVVDTHAVQSVTQEAILRIWKVKSLCVGSIDFGGQPRTKRA